VATTYHGEYRARQSGRPGQSFLGSEPVKVITAPNHPTSDELDAFWPTLFVSGGITGAPNWQPEYLDMLKDVDGLAFNPRRLEFDVRDPNNTVAQIEWEAKYLAFVNAISFWFPKEPLCPITLYELGRWTSAAILDEPDSTTLFIGVHPEYARRDDVEIQTKLALPEIKLVYSLEDLAAQVREWAQGPGIREE